MVGLLVVVGVVPGAAAAIAVLMRFVSSVLAVVVAFAAYAASRRRFSELSSLTGDHAPRRPGEWGRHDRRHPRAGRMTLAVPDREGRANREIGVALKPAEKTVENYVWTILSGLEIRRRSEAAAYLARHTGTSGEQG
jgi:DNA-binding NarL/FixJ family response regulator